MHKIIKLSLLSFIAILLVATPVFAYLYRAPLTIVESNGTAYSMLPWMVRANNQWMADNGFMEADALDTRVQTLGGLNKPHMVTGVRTLSAVPVLANSQTNLYFVTGESDLSGLDVIIGYDGYVTIPDDASIELGNNFEVEWKGWIDTSSGSDKNLVYKEYALKTRISAGGSISSVVATSGYSGQIGASADDCFRRLNADNFSLVQTAPAVGYIAAGNQQCGVGLRFTNIAIAQGGTIDGAYLTFTCKTTKAVTTVNSKIKGEDIDTALTFTDSANFDARDKTTAVVTWSPGAWTADAEYDSPDIKAIIQEVVDRPGWSSGNDLVIFWEDFDDLSSAGAYRNHYSWNDDPAKAPELHILLPLTVTAVNVTSGEHTVTVKTELKTETFYPDAGVNSVDGHAYHGIVAGTLLWDDLATGVGTGASDVATVMRVLRWDNHTDANEYEMLFRGISLFDTSGLPDDAVVVSATLSIYGLGKTDPNADTPNLNVYSSAPVADNAIVAGDFDSLGSTAFCDTPITYAGYNVAGYNDFVLNATGRAAVDVAGVSKFGFRNVNYDVANNPPVWASGSTTYMNAYTIEEGVDKAPKLEVSYYELVIYIDAVEEDRETLGAGVPDNSNDWAIMENNCIPYMEYMTIDVSSVEKLKYLPTDMITDTQQDGTADAGSSDVKLIDAELDQADDYWNLARLIITDTTDDLAPKGETAVVTDFLQATDELQFAALTAGIDAGDTYDVSFGTLEDETGTNDGTVTWGHNPTGVEVELGSMVSSGQPAIGVTIEDIPGSVLPEATVSDWFGDGTVGGSILTNPIRPFITMVSDNTDLTEILVWRWMGVALLLFLAVASARLLRGHLGITSIIVAAAMGGLVSVDHNIFPLWLLVMAVGMFIGGLVAERSPSL